MKNLSGSLSTLCKSGQIQAVRERVGEEES